MQTTRTVERRGTARQTSSSPRAASATPLPIALNTPIPLNMDEGAFYDELDEHLKMLY